MIAVLSDDFSSAAELACIGAAQGLRAKVRIGWKDSQNPAVDLVAIDCGTRAPLPASTPTLLVKPGSYPWPAWALPHHSLCP